jgi:hypothetical protein
MGAYMNILHLRSRAERLFRRIAIPGWALIVWTVIEKIDTANFIRESFAPVWTFAKSPAGTLVLMICGFVWLVLVIIWPRHYDTSTLGGFALKLRDDLKQFVERYPKPKDTIVGMGNDEMIRKIDRLHGPENLRAAALEHGYYLHFKDRVDRIYHEFGRFGIQNRELDTVRAEQKFDTGYTYEVIADALERLSHLPEAARKMT